MLLRRRDGFLVSCIGVPGYTNPRIVGQNPFKADAHLRSAVGDDHLTGVERVADADSPTVVE